MTQDRHSRTVGRGENRTQSSLDRTTARSGHFWTLPQSRDRDPDKGIPSLDNHASLT